MKKQNPVFKVHPGGSADDHDYKLKQTEQEAQRNFESIDKWLYLGADDLDKKFAKIGITMGDLASRSYSSTSPSYYLFCAFKCNHSISREKLDCIEDDVLSKIDSLYRNPDGSSKRMVHYESGERSECFNPVSFIDFFKDVHRIIHEHHRSSFVISGWQNEFGVDDGEFVDCIFNKKLQMSHIEFIKMIIQHN